MSRQLVFRPQVEQEVAAATEWYDSHGAGLAAEFLRAFDAVLASIQRNPLQYPEIYPRMRSALFRRFPYRLVFSVSASEIVILSCSHWRQNPRRWQTRS